MDPSLGPSAFEVVNGYEQSRLERVIRDYGEERFANRIARSIVEARPIDSTLHLAEVVRAAIPAATRRSGGHPARRTFQAIRIEVNDELVALRRGLPQAIDALEPGGRVVVLSYHSLEDRIVKRQFAAEARDCTCPPGFPVCRCGARARLRILTRRPVRPTANELSTNRRAQAARLRGAQRLGPSDEAA
jgi:16S rRNA (cytosine1402-N4)-methyltransferase